MCILYTVHSTSINMKHEMDKQIKAEVLIVEPNIFKSDQFCIHACSDA